ncbi:MAG: bifunctional ornithine acetyltransferase/N-acetylglutamate synthase [Cyanobacteria bacterium]|nr:bifunctional ornithine acetyltransferase/N-acetylglutamate synthase [Cyanobacteria bacterium CG_2015-16_32_12]NCO79383.1 bifunctional ornithine acetyltransferase/N-acetylglutamate synthase [Cyanobacteria bacterium CG_2015-22_32_23]NCQ05473.1 bifunctional ornithine acetyltransferase/N-acetylglutamate synthase [Cyanobacteria bacterium CG_2015-09_32_10]NCQ41401.1 bifunctional ornithine acetyltransferase/N-acetylglutamate synthase [Cyanobacteria bacterium CG_2015-04_32_10]NCS85657.1 bifunctional
MSDWKVIEGGVTAPKGFKSSGITAGLKASKSPDLSLIYSETEAIAAGVFTTSEVRAACVDYCRQKLQKKSSAKAILCNSGQANAATGAQGWQDAKDSAEALAKELNIDADSILLASTGVIGQRIKMDIMINAFPQLVAELSENGGEATAKAIITTDLVTKSIALETIIDDRPVRIGGISKGSGMIHPNMATMLGFITCDAAVSTNLWQQMLKRAADKSFNQITVDGDTSTNDSLIALANGQSRTRAITSLDENGQKLEAMLTEVCQYLAKAIARDGEGATCLMEVEVQGATDETSARQIAKTIVGSSLVKSAIFGRDPNWGRIAAAAGRAGVQFNQDDLMIKLGDFLLMERGQPQPFDRIAASNYLKQAATGEYLKTDTVAISVSVGNGSGVGKAWGCDLSYDYVKINAEYTT